MIAGSGSSGALVGVCLGALGLGAGIESWGWGVGVVDALEFEFELCGGRMGRMRVCVLVRVSVGMEGRGADRRGEMCWFWCSCACVGPVCSQL